MTNPTLELVLELIQRSKNKKKDTCFLTAYLPISSYNNKDIKTQIKSKLLDEFRSHKEFANYSEHHNSLVKEFLDQMEDIQAINNGIALFLKIRRSDLKYGLKKAYWKAYLLEKKPKEEVNILDGFDVDQLIADLNYSMNSLVVTLDRKQSIFYKLVKGKLEYLHTIDNEGKYVRGAEYTQKYAPRRNIEVYHGSGGKNLERMENRQDHHFWGNMVDEIISYINKNQDIKYIVVFHSSNFSKFQDEIENEVRKHVEQQVIVEAKDFSGEDEIRDESISALNSLVDNNVRQLIDSLNENIQQAAFGWEEVLSMSRQKRIEVLFLKPRLNKSGYIFENGIYHKFVEGAEFVENIVPLLVVDVIEAGGEIIIVDEKMPTKEEIFAKLRY